jgi:sigma-B regulation protein RsbU (phosphoserine phosphatase)
MPFKQGSPLILVADDDKWTRTLLRLILQQDRYRIIEVENGEQCLAEYRQQHPDIVLLDALMPEMDGFTCCLELTSLPGGDRTPILMITGLEDRESIDRAFEVGATDYITKPIHPPLLRQRLRRVLATVWAQEALLENEKKYRSVVENLREVIFQTDTDGELTFLNPAWTAITGFSQSASLGKKLVEFIHAEDRQIYQHYFQSLITGSIPECRYQIRYLTDSNHFGWMEVYACPMLIDNRTVRGISGTLNDVTERQRQAQYQKSEYETTRVLAESATLAAAIPHIIQAICESLEWDLGEFWQVGAESGLLHLQANFYGCEELRDFSDSSQTIAFASEIGLPGRIWAGGKSLWMPNVLEDPHFQRKEIAAQAGLKAAFGFPIVAGNEKLGVMAFFNRDIQKYEPDLLKIVSAIGSQIGQFIKRKQAEEELQKRNEILQLELNQAAEYVASLLPSPFNGSIAIEQRFIPSAQLGGDVFDYYWLDENHLAIYLLDVAGHGVSSALLSVSLLNVLRTQSLGQTNFYQPQTVLKELNQRFKMNDKGDNYFTIWYGVFQPATRQLVYAAAGHPPAILISPSVASAPLQKLSARSLPIGMLPEFNFVQNCCKIPQGSSLYIFSDGIYEIPQANGQVWGINAFIDVLADLHQSNKNYLDEVLLHVKAINGKEAFDDDLSILKLAFS